MITGTASIRHDQLLVGFKPIDDLHREFQSIIDVLNDPAEADYAEILCTLHEHLLRHCGAEEQFMLQEDFPHYARHKKAHEYLLESISDVRRKFDAGDIEAVHRYTADLIAWFAVHATTEDADLAAFLKGPPSRAPVAGAPKRQAQRAR